MDHQMVLTVGVLSSGGLYKVSTLMESTLSVALLTNPQLQSTILIYGQMQLSFMTISTFVHVQVFQTGQYLHLQATTIFVKVAQLLVVGNLQ